MAGSVFWRQLPTALPSGLDAGLAVLGAVVLPAATVLTSRWQDQARPLDTAAFALIISAALVLAWHRRAPVVVLGVVVALVSVYLLIGYPYGPVQLCVVFAIFEVARLRSVRVSLVACAVAAAATAAAILLRDLLPADTPALLLAVWLSWQVIPWSVGALVQARVAAARRARLELAARAALEERMRIARDVHDVAGHGLAAVAMQAGVALLVFDEQPGQAKASLEMIQSTSAKALADLRIMLAAFDRRGGIRPSQADVETAPGLHDLPTLADEVRAAGLPVQLSIEDVAVPAGIGHVAYRVVQEALTNTLRHAGPTVAQVGVRRQGVVLEVEVVDGGVAGGEVQPGMGISGMRARVVAVGGQFVARPRSGGGFRVSASLPLGGEPA